MTAVQDFGQYKGDTVQCARLDGLGGLHAEILTYGATLKSLVIDDPDGGQRNLVLSLPAFEDYPRSPYFGATVGRFGNRIGGAAFTLDGQHYQLDRNQDGRHHLHGGAGGLTKRLWRMREDGGSLLFETSSPAGDQGYPGDFEASCRYSLTEPCILRIEMTATVSEACPVNLVHHSYWNLDGGGTIDGHALEVEADSYLPTEESQIPTGEILPVAGTPYDFRKMRKLDANGEPVVDFCFPLRPEPGLRRVAELVSGDGRLQMTLASNQPAVQVYTGWKLDETASDGRHIGPRSGICLETQAFPDAPNKPQFPSSILRPGDTYRHVMEHRFAWR